MDHCGISYLYVDIFREHDLFSQRFLRLYFMRVCVGPSQIWRIPVEPLVHTRVTRYMRGVADERVCTHRSCLRAYLKTSKDKSMHGRIFCLKLTNAFLCILQFFMAFCHRDIMHRLYVREILHIILQRQDFSMSRILNVFYGLMKNFFPFHINHIIEKFYDKSI